MTPAKTNPLKFPAALLVSRRGVGREFLFGEAGNSRPWRTTRDVSGESAGGNEDLDHLRSRMRFTRRRSGLATSA